MLARRGTGSSLSLLYQGFRGGEGGTRQFPNFFRNSARGLEYYLWVSLALIGEQESSPRASSKRKDLDIAEGLRKLLSSLKKLVRSITFTKDCLSFSEDPWMLAHRRSLGAALRRKKGTP